MLYLLNMEKKKELLKVLADKIDQQKALGLKVIAVEICKQDSDEQDIAGTEEVFVLRQPHRREMLEASRRSDGMQNIIAFSDHLVKCCVVGSTNMSALKEGWVLNALGEQMGDLMDKARTNVEKL